MNFVSKTAIGAALALCGTSFVVALPAQAQENAKPAKERQYKLSNDERKAIVPFQTAVQAKDAAAAAAALPAAKEAVKGGDAQFVLGSLMVQLGRDTNSDQMIGEGVDLVINSGTLEPEQLAQYYGVQADLALKAKDLGKAEAALSRMTELNPNNPDALMLLGNVKNQRQQFAEATALFDRAIEMKKASGQQVDQSWYKVALKNAYQTKQLPQSVKASRDLVAAYPTVDNWRDSIQIYRELARPAKDIDTDALRFLRMAKALKGESDYYTLADNLNTSGFPGEAKAVLDEGVASNAIDGSKQFISQLRTNAGGKIAEDKASLASSEKSALAAANGKAALQIGDAYFGYGDYAKAISLYRAALQKGGIDANVVNTHLAMALALSGQKAEAEAALKAVTGPRAELANFMLVWLGQQA